MLAIQALSVSLGITPTLHNIDLSIARGEVVALIGPNGAGKSTLIRTISGVIKPTTGSVTFDGQDILNLPIESRARIMAVVSQARQLGGAFSVEQTVMMGRTAHMDWLGRPMQADLDIVNAVMRDTQIDHLADRRIASLSGGEQQRVLFARALAQAPSLLLLDEPTNHLDLKHQAGILELTRAQAGQKNLAVLMALHDLNLVALFADRVILLHEGRIAADGVPQQVIRTEIIEKVYDARISIVHSGEDQRPIVVPRIEGRHKLNP
jgi:iron complex transport system ATP-binding protein